MENNLSFSAITEAFLARCLEGRYQPVVDDFQGATVQALAGAQEVRAWWRHWRQEPQPERFKASTLASEYSRQRVLSLNLSGFGTPGASHLRQEPQPERFKASTLAHLSGFGKPGARHLPSAWHLLLQES